MFYYYRSWKAVLFWELWAVSENVNVTVHVCLVWGWILKILTQLFLSDRENTLQGLQGASDSENTSGWSVIYPIRRFSFRGKNLRHMKQRADGLWRGKLFFSFPLMERSSGDPNTSRGPKRRFDNIEYGNEHGLFCCKVSVFPLLLLSLERLCFLLMLLCSSFLHRLRRWSYIFVSLPSDSRY